MTTSLDMVLTSLTAKKGTSPLGMKIRKRNSVSDQDFQIEHPCHQRYLL
jgi:hypothetical protein